jgi:hypothetical protein
VIVFLKGEVKMIVIPIYNCRNCKKIYPGNKQEIPNAQLDSLVRAARFTLGSPDHVFRIGGKTIQLSDLHQCNENEIGLANFIKLQITREEEKDKKLTKVLRES